MAGLLSSEYIGSPVLVLGEDVLLEVAHVLGRVRAVRARVAGGLAALHLDVSHEAAPVLVPAAAVLAVEHWPRRPRTHPRPHSPRHLPPQFPRADVLWKKRKRGTG